MHDATFGMQRAMEHLQANGLGTPTHRLVRVRDSPDTSKAADAVAECPFANFVFDCGVILYSYDVADYCTHPHHCQNFSY